MFDRPAFISVLAFQVFNRPQLMSGKFNLIDHETFESIHQSSNSSPSTRVAKIRNAKYKRMTSNSGFSLLEFVKPKSNVKICKGKPKNSKRIVDVRIRPAFKKRGKQRENEHKKKINRLKKSILRYRQLKREQQIVKEELQNEIETQISNQLQTLTLASGSNKQSEVSGLKNRIHSNRFRE